MTQAEWNQQIYDDVMGELADIKKMLVELGATDPAAPPPEEETPPATASTKKGKSDA